MTLRPRGGTWHFRYKSGGEEYSGSALLPATAENRAFASKWENSLRTLDDGGRVRNFYKPSRAVGFTATAEAFLRWLNRQPGRRATTRKRIRASLASAMEFFADTPVNSIHEPEIERYKAWRRETVLESTLRHDVQALSMLFQYAIRRRRADENPTGKPIFPRRRVPAQPGPKHDS
jgi:hypothetical protein